MSEKKSPSHAQQGQPSKSDIIARIVAQTPLGIAGSPVSYAILRAMQFMYAGGAMRHLLRDPNDERIASEQIELAPDDRAARIRALLNALPGDMDAEEDIEGSRHLQLALGDLPVEYDALTSALDRLRGGFHAELASVLEGPLNNRAQEMPHATYDEKRSLAKWVNAELHRFGLAIKCPKTGKPAFLVGHPGGRPGVGRFHLEVLESNGRPKRTVTSVTLPHMTLMADLPRRQLEHPGQEQEHTR